MSPAKHIDPTTGRPIRNPYRENSEFARFGLRILRSMSRRAGADIDMLPVIAEMAAGLDELMHEAIDGVRAEGYSWADIAERLGTTRQAAHKRYGATRPPCSIRRQPAVDATDPVPVERVG